MICFCSLLFFFCSAFSSEDFFLFFAYWHFVFYSSTLLQIFNTTSKKGWTVQNKSKNISMLLIEMKTESSIFFLKRCNFTFISFKIFLSYEFHLIRSLQRDNCWLIRISSFLAAGWSLNDHCWFATTSHVGVNINNTIEWFRSLPKDVSRFVQQT